MTGLWWAWPVWLSGLAGVLTGLSVALLVRPPGEDLLRNRFGVAWISVASAQPGTAGSDRAVDQRTGEIGLVGAARRALRSWPGRRLPIVRGDGRRDRGPGDPGPSGPGPTEEVPREAYTVLGAELRAGRPAEVALAAAATVAPGLEPAARAARSGGDVGAALRDVGSGGRALALAWSVGQESGIGLAALVERVADGIADDQEIRREVQAQLAGPRATARMLAGLPVIGILLGSGFGDPLGFLLGSGLGLACLAASVLLAVLGLCWVERLAARAAA